MGVNDTALQQAAFKLFFKVKKKRNQSSRIILLSNVSGYTPKLLPQVPRPEGPQKSRTLPAHTGHKQTHSQADATSLNGILTSIKGCLCRETKRPSDTLKAFLTLRPSPSPLAERGLSTTIPPEVEESFPPTYLQRKLRSAVFRLQGSSESPGGLVKHRWPGPSP